MMISSRLVAYTITWPNLSLKITMWRQKMISPKEMTIVEKGLKLAGHMLSAQTCDDTPNDWLSDFTEEEIVDLDRRIWKWNGDPEEHDPSLLLMIGGGGMILSFLASELETENG